LPISLIFVKTILADNASVSVGATHEICEMAVDPWLNSACQDVQGTFWACEVCDPVEDGHYGYEIDGVRVTDFVTPNWFGPQHAVGDNDYKRQTRAAFEVLSGGYAQKFDPQQGWVQITGAKALGTSALTLSGDPGANAGSGSGRRRNGIQASGLRPAMMVAPPAGVPNSPALVGSRRLNCSATLETTLEMLGISGQEGERW